MSDTFCIEQPAQVSARAVAVQAELRKLASNIEDGFFDTCDLLHEVHEQKFHFDFGFVKFTDWVEQAGLDMSARQAMYCVNIADKALTLAVGRDVLKKVKISKLKEIFSLDPNEHSREMRELLEKAEFMTLDEVKAAVKALKADAGVEEMLFMTLKYPQSAKAVYDGAFEKVKAEHGGYDGEDISNGRAVELICADYLGDAPVEVAEPQQTCTVCDDQEGGCPYCTGKQD